MDEKRQIQTRLGCFTELYEALYFYDVLNLESQNCHYYYCIGSFMTVLQIWTEIPFCYIILN
jgi:hypothetical protein